MKQAFYILLGAFLTAGFSFLLNLYSNHREDKIHLREKREDAYYKMIHFYDVISISPVRREKLPENINELLHEYRALITMYGSHKVRKQLFDLDEQYSKTFNGLNPTEEFREVYAKMMKQIHKELNIKD